MAFDNSYTAITGGTLSAAQWNTHVRDNFAALWPYTAAGDLAYATSATTLTRLAKGLAGQFLKMNASATAPEWAYAGGVKIDSFSNATPYSVVDLSATRDMPNSSKAVTVTSTSTIITIGNIVMYGQGSYGLFDAYFNIDGVDISSGFMSSHAYQIGEYDTVTLLGIRTSVPAGSRTIKIREVGGTGHTYTVERKAWIAFIIPE
jgi:hypothetical protein